MTNYNDVEILSILEVSFSEPSRFEVTMNYSSSEVFLVPTKLTLSTTLGMTNFTGTTPFDPASDVLCEYKVVDPITSEISWVDIKTLVDPTISFSSNSVDPTSYQLTYTMNSNPNVDDNSIMNMIIRFRLSGSFLTALGSDYSLFVMEFTPTYAFSTNFATPPGPTILSQPQNITYSESDSVFEIQYKYWNSTEINSSWQYSDNYNPGSPELATWSEVTDGTVSLNSLFGDTWSVAAGVYDSGSIPVFVTTASTLTISSIQYEANPNRVYRYKYVVV